MRLGKVVSLLASIALTAALAAGCGPNTSAAGDNDAGGNNNENNNNNNYVPPECPDGIDNDGDGYGENCPAGPDCNDRNPDVHPAATEAGRPTQKGRAHNAQKGQT